MRAVAFAAAALALFGCQLASPVPTEIPIGGERAEILDDDLALARTGMPGGLLEPTWLPGGFELIHVSLADGAGDLDSVDLAYSDGTHWFHVWQSRADAGTLVGRGERVEIGGHEWWLIRIDPAQSGRDRPNPQLSTRLDDGRIVSVDSDLDDRTIFEIIEGMRIHPAPPT